MLIHQPIPLILASGSSIRQAMLRNLGLTFSVVPSGIDEESLKTKNAHQPIPKRALALAQAKALSVATQYPAHLTIGADQMCEFSGNILSKPITYDKAEAQLAMLAGNTHYQHSAVVLARGSDILFSFTATASLSMRHLSDAEISAYVAADAPLTSCGSYKFEAMGRHLFSSITGDNDTIQGLPLVPLLNALHSHGGVVLR